jgi:pimeloyl-ACP methyl ester carboxylesterase
VLLATHRFPGYVLDEHRFELPLDHERPDGGQVSVFAREIAADTKERATRPWLLFLQGGPGMGATRPDGQELWIKRAVKDYRVLLLDQRGTGISSTVNHQSLERLEGPEEQADYLKHFRADSIVRDAEAIRRELIRDETWSVIGQSYGGFCVCTYLSLAPEGLREAFVTGGLPPLQGGPDDVYRATYRRVSDRNRRFYERYPEDADRVRAIVDHLEQHDVRLPDGERLTTRRFLAMGSHFGMSDGLERVHYLVERAFVDGKAGPEIGYPFLRELDHGLSFEEAPIYAVLHEAIYCQGEASRWSADRVRGEFPEFEADPPFFTGEMVYRWMFDDYGRLRPLGTAADLLAEYDGWPGLYDAEVLRANVVPSVAAVYADDMYVERGFSEETARTIQGMRTWVTEDYQHDALRRDGDKILDRLLGLLHA